MTLSADRARRVLYILTALRWLPVGLRLPVTVLYMTDRGLSLSQVGIAAAAYGITIAVLELPTGGVADAVGRRPVLVASAVLRLASLGLFLVATSQPAFLISRIVGGASRALDTGPLQGWYVDTALAANPHRDLEADLSGAETLTGIALGVGSLLGGAVGLAAGLPVAADLGSLAIPIVVAIAGRLVQAAGMAGLAAANGLPLFYGTYLGFYAGNGTTAVAHDALLHRATDEHRATVLSINSLTASAGSFVGNTTLPALADATTIPVAWLVAGTAHLAAIPLYLRTRHQPVPASGS